MTISEKELEKRLIAAGNSLLSPPSDVIDLLDSLYVVENLLVGVEQSPSGSMKEALVPSTKALITNELLRHSDVDVKVAVAACISEITRITAPDAPYADEQMKEIFQLIVSSFDKLDDKSSRSYTRRISILETVAKVRSCVVMLDLECDALIVEMFRHFFKTIRDDHHPGVLDSMLTIMTLVIEESEDISVDLLSSILDVLKKENVAVLPKARELGEGVVVNCAIKLKPFLLPAVRSSGASLADYSKVVADVYQAGDEAVEPTTGDPSKTNLADDKNLINPSSEKAVEVAMDTLEGAPPAEESSKTVISNGIPQKGIEESSAADENSKGADNDTQDEKGEPTMTNADSVNAAGPPKSKAKPKKGKKRKGKKTNTSKKKSSKPLEPVESNRETKTLEAKDDPMDVDDLGSGNPAIDDTDNREKISDAPIATPGDSINEHADKSLPSPSGRLADEPQSKTPRQRKKKEKTIPEGEPADDVDSGKESDTGNDSEEPIGSKNGLNKDSSENTSASDHDDGGPDSADDSGEEADTALEVDNIPAKDLAKETKVGSGVADKRKRGQAKATPLKGKKKTPAKHEKKKASISKSASKVTKDESDVEEASRSTSKRKRGTEEKTPKTNVNGKKLIGATIKVWWPDDKKYYEGVIDSFDATEEKHTILYNDGDVEILDLKDEKWQFIPEAKDHASENPDESAEEMPKGKKTKTNADLGSKQGKSVSASKKSVPSSSKSKTPPKFAGKSDAKAKASGNKLSTVPASKSAKKSKKDDDDDDEDETPIGSIKTKQETVKGAANSKGKSPKIVGSKPISSAKSAKAKGGTSVKDDEDEDTEDESLEPEKSPEKLKSKSKKTPPKSQKSSKKRRR